MGGWHDVNLTDARVLSATNFVITQTFGETKEWTLVEAKQQIVNGMNLDISVQIDCELHKFRIHTGHEYMGNFC